MVPRDFRYLAFKSNYFFNYKWHNKRKLMIGCEYMDTTKARIQGNAVVVTIPKSLGVEPGTEYRFSKESDGSLKLTPTKKYPKPWLNFLRMAW